MNGRTRRESEKTVETIKWCSSSVVDARDDEVSMKERKTKGTV